MHSIPVLNKRNRPSSLTTTKLVPLGLKANRNVVETLISKVSNVRATSSKLCAERSLVYGCSACRQRFRKRLDGLLAATLCTSPKTQTSIVFPEPNVSALMEACVRHLRVPKDDPAGKASVLLIQDTLQTLGQQAICHEVTNLLLILEGQLMKAVYDCRHPAGGISVAIVCFENSSAVHAGIGPRL